MSEELNRSRNHMSQLLSTINFIGKTYTLNNEMVSAKSWLDKHIDSGYGLIHLPYICGTTRDIVEIINKFNQGVNNE